MMTNTTKMRLALRPLLIPIGVLLAWATTTTLAQQQSDSLPPGVVAEQGGVQISLKDIDAYADRMPANDRVGFFDSPKRIEHVIMDLLLRKQLAAKARQDGIDQQSGVQQQIRQAVDDTLARVELQHYRDNLKLPQFDELAREYYLTHKDEFVKPGKVDVKHVLVSTKERGDEEAKAIIGKVEATARAHPDQFDALIAKYSDDPSAKDNHGLIADAASGNMVAPFAKAAGALSKPGQISPIVKTQYGYHVLKLISRQPDHQQSFDEIRKNLVKRLKSNWIDKQVTEFTGEMRGNALHANPELVASLRTRYLAPGEELPSEQAAAMDAAKADAAAREHATKAKQGTAGGH